MAKRIFRIRNFYNWYLQEGARCKSENPAVAGLQSVLLATGVAHPNLSLEMSNLSLLHLSEQVDRGIDLSDEEVRLAADLLASP
ncbi:uncharacterized protein METZ01_LOCUS472787, partial [marine metagenome]